MLLTQTHNLLIKLKIGKKLENKIEINILHVRDLWHYGNENIAFHKVQVKIVCIVQVGIMNHLRIFC